jgi:hypothetical protein
MVWDTPSFQTLSVLGWDAEKHRVNYWSCSHYPEAKQREQAWKARSRRSFTNSQRGGIHSDWIVDEVIRRRYPLKLLYISRPVQPLAIKFLGSDRRLRPQRHGNRQRGRKCGFS